jgi:hypothetical protein
MTLPTVQELTEQGHLYLLANDLSYQVQYIDAGKVLGRFFTEQAATVAAKLNVVTYVQESEPYATIGDLVADIYTNNTLRIARTEPGTTPLWGEAENDAMRLWHDYSHHYLLGLSFGLLDEYRAFQAAASEFYNWALVEHDYSFDLVSNAFRILYNEMVLQPAAAVWLGGYGATRYELTFSQKITNIGA